MWGWRSAEPVRRCGSALPVDRRRSVRPISVTDGLLGVQVPPNGPLGGQAQGKKEQLGTVPYAAFAPNSPQVRVDRVHTYLHLSGSGGIGTPGREVAQQLQLLDIKTKLDAVVAAGTAEFGNDDVSTLLGGAITTVNTLASGACDGFFEQNSTAAMPSR